jgi:hypothetical protein
MWLILARLPSVLAGLAVDAGPVVAVGERPEESSFVPIAASLPGYFGSAASDRSILAYGHEKTLAIRRGFWSFSGLRR